uniref:solute carrier family 22 member 5-like isoform X1 n=1 Tax=Styela clava TaxID=7725 RepID=UPI001939F31E|nr:solute carrier family 22 member 5-like isoform X1 [Styela clava]
MPDSEFRDKDKIENGISRITENCGKYQKQLFLIMMVTSVLIPIAFLCNALLTDKNTEHFCNTSEDIKISVSQVCNKSWTLTQDLLTIPLNNDTKQLDHCYKYDLGLVLQPIDCSFWFQNDNSSNSSVAENTQTHENQTFNTTKCTSWSYHNDIFHSTVDSRFNLVCDNAWKAQIASLSLMFGVLVGSVIFGLISDRYGRKSSFAIALYVLAASEFISTFVRNFAVYCIMQLCTGSGFIGVCTAGFIMGMELLSSRHRVIAAQFFQCTFPVGFMLFALVGYLIPNWRTVGQLSSVVILFIVLIFWRVALESPRWLYARNRLEDANRIINKIAKLNGYEQKMELVPPMEIGGNEESEEMINTPANTNDPEILTKFSFLVLFTNRTLRKITIILCYNWFAVTSIYYGLSFSTTQLSGNVFLNIFYTGLVDIPANCCAGLLMKYWGRRPVVCVFNFLSSTALLCMMFVPQDMSWLILILFLTGKFGTTGAFGGVYLYTSELYPTPIRGNGLGCCSGFSRIGGMSAILILMLGSIWKTLPYIVFGVISFLAGFLVLILPETKNNGFPETIEECKKMDNNRTISLKSQFCPFGKR